MLSVVTNCELPNAPGGYEIESVELMAFSVSAPESEDVPDQLLDVFRFRGVVASVHIMEPLMAVSCEALTVLLRKLKPPVPL